MADDDHELSALYALDALSGQDRARFEEHLATCARCRTDVDAFRATAGWLAYVPEGPAPPAALRDRILVAARAEGTNVVPLASRRPRVATVAVGALAVAATAAAIAFGLWASSLHGSLQHARSVEAVVANPHSRRVQLAGVQGALYVAPDGTAALAAALPRPAAGKTYEAWLIVGSGEPTPAGLFSGGTTVLRGRVRPGSVVKVTVEPSGGVDRPTTIPILSATV